MARDLEPGERTLLEEMQRKWDEATRFRKPIERKWIHYFGLYNNWTDFRNQYADAAPRDRYDGLRQAKKSWGAELFIPFAYATVETIVPRMIAKPPRMLVVPGVSAAQDNVKNMKGLIDAQQDQADYELTAQATAKSGLIYGLGVEKSYWRQEEQTRKRLAKASIPIPGRRYIVKEGTESLYDDPFAEDLDVFNWMWDPFGHDMRTIGWCFHRTWRSTGYCLDRLETGQWTYPLKVDDLENQGSPQKWTESWSDRLRAQQLGDAASRVGEGNIHEVWEFHDRERVVVILDREWPVVEGRNPAWHGDLPFAIYRPTEVPHQMVGKGEIEPIEDLQEEMNTLRSQRRDNATIVLQRTFAYAEGYVDQRDLKLGPGMAIPVNGDPRELLFPLPVGDIPNSSYQEENNLKADIERVTGISDPVTGSDLGSGSASATATGVQIVLDAANQRIKLKTQRLLVECVRRVTNQWIELNQQKILSEKEYRAPVPPTPGEPDRAWEWIKVSPEELWGPMEARADAGATAPDNVPQMRQDAQMAWTMFSQRPEVDSKKLLVWTMRNMGIAEPETYIAPGGPPIPPETIDKIIQLWTGEMTSLAQGLIRNGFDPTQLPPELQHPDVHIREMVGQAVKEADAQQPAPAQEAMAQNGAGPPQGEPVEQQ